MLDKVAREIEELFVKLGAARHRRNELRHDIVDGSDEQRLTERETLKQTIQRYVQRLSQLKARQKSLAEEGTCLSLT